MQTAILYSGQTRTFASCFPNQWWMVLRHYPDPVVYVSIAEDDQSCDMELLRQKFPDVTIQVEKQPDFPEAAELETKHLHSGYPRSARVQNVLRSFWSMEQVWKMAKEDIEKFQPTVIRIRPDIWFKEFEKPYMAEVRECITPPWGSYGGMNDRFAIMGHKAAEKYFTVFSRYKSLLEQGCPLHPETMQRAALEEGRTCYVRPHLITDFRIRRLPDAQHGNKEWEVPEPILGIELLRASLTS